MEMKRKRRYLRLHDCRFNAGCACEKMICSRCWWNPAVAAQRAVDKKQREAEARNG